MFTYTQEGGVPATRLRWAPIDDLAADCRAYGIDQYVQNLMICAGSTTGKNEFINRHVDIGISIICFIHRNHLSMPI